MSANFFTIILFASSLGLTVGCKTTAKDAAASVKDVSATQIDLSQIDSGEAGYTPDPGMYYVWDNGTGQYHVEVNDKGTQGYYWLNNQKLSFENGCRASSSDISCTGSKFSFYAPRRMDAFTHIYGGAVLKQLESQDSKIFLTQVEASDGDYTPDPGMYYVWDSADRVYHVEMSSDGRSGALWVNQQKYFFDSCRRGSTDMSCSGAGYKFYAPMRMDAPHHIYASGALERQ